MTNLGDPDVDGSWRNRVWRRGAGSRECNHGMV